MPKKNIIIVTIGAIAALSFGAITAAASDGSSFGPEQAHSLPASTTAVQLQASAAPPREATPALQCVQVNNTTWSSCKDAGGVDSTCAKAQCGAGYMLTGGGGSCAAGDRKLKSLYPKLSTREFGITCEKQGVTPQVHAICCKI